MKTAIIHDWLVTYAGAERVLEQIVALFPDADLYSVVDFLRDDQRHFLMNKKAHTSFIQKMPLARKKYRSYLPFMPFAVEHFDISSYDLVISSSHAVAKGTLTHANQLHICYCHTPMRYAWDLHDQYLRESGLDRGLKGMLAKLVLQYVRRWDASTADRVDHFIANSQYIADRIKRAYNRDASVIYPPVDIDGFSLSTAKEDFYLAASRMVPYKKMDLIVETFSIMPDKRLVVIGDGPDFDKVRSKAGRNVELIGYQPSDALKEYLQKARAFVFAAEEDFGIIPVEAQACGTPVIAYGRGGVTETVIPLRNAPDRDIRGQAACGMRNENQMPPTGVFFHEQTPEALIEAVRDFEKNKDIFDHQEIRKNAQKFNRERFKKEFKEFVDKVIEGRR